ncbi:Beta-lactamase-like protein [Arcticibacter svalbardensis MN12-7]|uniref:Beta-lactamase-like protein n=1 Tax=Arcticibacter svalbardensis MN12-7 TaxID=1150600 RepID=R9GWL1_9SPHI|nr:MBL fold metallo-hydrolase [Arcticibacter svalbardensis]EOR96177.1 Beta-lactamase-like protein [Arcticibacter svalbardensis MN12-7]
MNLYSINTGHFKLDGGAMFGVVPKTIWNKTNPADENNLIELAMRCLLIQTDDRLTLVDTGIGDKQSEKALSYYHLYGEHTLDHSLASHGFSRKDITDVFLTHLHLDHAGAAVMKENEVLIPSFPNAVYWSNSVHWNWALHPNDREKASFLRENFLPLRKKNVVKFIDGDQHNLFPQEITIKLVSGHTESMMLPIIQYKGKTIVFVADLIPTVSHIPIPYVPGYDVYPLKSMDEKRSFLQEAVDNNYILFFEHDPYIECCTLQMTEKGVRIADTFLLKDL